MIKYTRIIVLLILDMLMINFSYILAFLLRFDFDVDSSLFTMYFGVFGSNMLPITLIHVLAFMIFRVYTSMWRYASAKELEKIVLGAIFGCILVISYMSIIQQLMPRSLYLISCIIIMLLLAVTRLGYRFIRGAMHPNLSNFVLSIGKKDLIGANVTKVMLVGAGDSGANIIQEINRHPEYEKRIVVAIDDNAGKHGLRLNGVKIVGGREKIKATARKYGIEEIIIAVPSANSKVIKEIMIECNKTKCKARVVPELIDLINERLSVSKLKDIDIKDLLMHDPVNVNLREVSAYIQGNIVLVTGAGGSIGAELCRQIARFRPRRLIALDIDEMAMFALANEIKAAYPPLEFESVIGSICDQARMKVIFDRFKPNVVFHAAAHKHVALMEENPGQAVTNNILGTKILLDLAEEYIVNKFVLVSTAKAAKPTSVIGMTKRICEMMVQEKSGRSQTCYCAVRLGNVLGNNSVLISLMRSQIEAGGPVTIAHPEMTRYFTSAAEGAQLVIQAGASSIGGEIFLLDMGEPVNIMDLAGNFIKLMGYIPDEDIAIEITGMHQGEKLSEELFLADAGVKQATHEKIYIAPGIEVERELKDMLHEQGGAYFTEQVMEIACRESRAIKEWLAKVAVGRAT